MGIALAGFYKKGSDSDPIGMCLGSFWFKLVCDNSSKVLVAHFEKVLHNLTYFTFPSFNSSDSFLLLQIFDR